MPLHVSSTRAHRQEVKNVLYSLWYQHTETIQWSKIIKIIKITQLRLYNYEHYVFIIIESYFSNFRPLTCFNVMIPEAV